jgi:hypothetical protein
MDKVLSPEEERATWQYRAVAATKGNQSQLGCILLAVIGKNAKHPPQFICGASITSDGFIMCSFVDRDGVGHMGAFVGSVSDLVTNFRGLADFLKLNDVDRTEMFDKVRAWIKTDYRTKKTLF